MKSSFFSLSLFAILLISQVSLANKELFDAAMNGKWDKFWGIRLEDPSADLDYSEDGVSVRDLVEEVGYFDLLDPVEFPIYERPRLIPPTVEPTIARRTPVTRTVPSAENRAADPMEIDEDKAWRPNFHSSGFGF